MLEAGASRRQLTRTLNDAYADGLISEDTFVRRLEQVLRSRIIDPYQLVGDSTSEGAQPACGCAFRLR